MNAITVHTTTACQMCRATTRKLDKAGIQYHTIDVSQKEFAELADAIRERAAEKNEAPAMPYVTVYDEHNTLINDWFGFRPDLINELVK